MRQILATRIQNHGGMWHSHSRILIVACETVLASLNGHVADAKSHIAITSHARSNTNPCETLLQLQGLAAPPDGDMAELNLKPHPCWEMKENRGRQSNTVRTIRSRKVKQPANSKTSGGFLGADRNSAWSYELGCAIQTLIVLRRSNEKWMYILNQGSRNHDDKRKSNRRVAFE